MLDHIVPVGAVGEEDQEDFVDKENEALEGVCVVGVADVYGEGDVAAEVGAADAGLGSFDSAVIGQVRGMVRCDVRLEIPVQRRARRYRRQDDGNVNGLLSCVHDEIEDTVAVPEHAKGGDGVADGLCSEAAKDAAVGVVIHQSADRGQRRA